jgi:hypothetical protein
MFNLQLAEHSTDATVIDVDETDLILEQDQAEKKIRCCYLRICAFVFLIIAGIVGYILLRKFIFYK